MIAISSTVIAAAALAVAVWSSIQTRAHNELSVQPLLRIHFSNNPTSEMSGFLIENVGLGPAIVTSSQVKVNNKIMRDLGFFFGNCYIKPWYRSALAYHNCFR